MPRTVLAPGDTKMIHPCSKEMWDLLQETAGKRVAHTDNTGTEVHIGATRDLGGIWVQMRSLR